MVLGMFPRALGRELRRGQTNQKKNVSELGPGPPKDAARLGGLWKRVFGPKFLIVEREDLDLHLWGCSDFGFVCMPLYILCCGP